MNIDIQIRFSVFRAAVTSFWKQLFFIHDFRKIFLPKKFPTKSSDKGKGVVYEVLGQGQLFCNNAVVYEVLGQGQGLPGRWF